MSIFNDKNLKKSVKGTIVSKTQQGVDVTHDISRTYFIDNGANSVIIGLETKGGQQITVNLDKK